LGKGKKTTMKMRVADYLTDTLYKAGGEHVFLITGGMIMHLTDALLLHGKQKYICCHHEQAAVMAAEAYGRFTGGLGVAYVTAGPGALNTLTGIVGAWVDSSPCIIVAGQAKCSQAKVTGVRQFALQGFNTLPIFSQVTKYAVMLSDVSRVKYEVEKCIHLATNGRVGPVWIECPVDVQGSYFDPDAYDGFNPGAEFPTEPDIEAIIDEVLSEIARSERPCILAGAGVRLAGAISDLHRVAESFHIPVLTSRLGLDLMGFEQSLFVGHPGTYGDRAANFAIQNCDLLIIVGCRLGVGLVGYDYAGFAHRAKKIMVDIDTSELNKPSVIPDVKIHADAGVFLKTLLDRVPDQVNKREKWIDQTQLWKHRYPVDIPVYGEEKNGINSYHFMRIFSEKLPSDAVVVVDTGSCFHVHAQAFKVKFGQRHIITGGLSTMGYCPAATGVAVAAGRQIYCITGDGSFQFNIQELQTVKHNKLPICFIVLSNNGYLLIRHTQNNFMKGRFIGTHKETGVSFPDLKILSNAYGIDYVRIASIDELDGKLELVMSMKRPVICEVLTPSDQYLQPRVASKMLEDGAMVSMPYDHMFPFLPEEEYQNNQLADKN
jgi:acetolactate synthase-1/2/3 large subunit